jgi:hypothetical protein
MTSHTCHKGEVCPKYILCGSCRYEKSGIGANALRVTSNPDRQLVFQGEKEKILVCIKAIWDYGEDDGFENTGMSELWIFRVKFDLFQRPSFLKLVSRL